MRTRRTSDAVAAILPNTRETILEAAAAVLRDRGFAGLSTREVAARAGVPLSQIHYHFDSRTGLVVDLFEYQNDKLLERQTGMYADPALSLAEQWQRACDYLDEDLKSGYVRILMELWAAGWSDPRIATVVRTAISGWSALLTDVARRAEERFGPLAPFSAEEIATLVGAAFIGAEAFVLLGLDSDAVPVRRALRRFGEAISTIESKQS